MLTKIFIPSLELQPFIEGYIYSKVDFLQHDVIPRGKASLFFVFSENKKMIDLDNMQEVAGKHFFCANLGVRLRRIICDDYLDSICVVFRPFGLYKLLGIPQDIICDEMIELEDILPAYVKIVKEKLEENKHDLNKIVEILNQFLIGQLWRTEFIRTDRIMYATRTIMQMNGLISIDKLSSELYMSKRTLELEFKKYIGMSPKNYSQLVKFGKIERILLGASGKVDFQKICMEFNYYDQAHFIK